MYCILKTDSENPKISADKWNVIYYPKDKTISEFQMFFGRTGLDGDGNRLQRLFFVVSSGKFYWSKEEKLEVNSALIPIDEKNLEKELTPEEISELKLPIREHIKCEDCIHHYKRRMNGCHSEKFKAM